MKPERKIAAPRKFDDYWDMNIPTQFYEEDFIEFERYMTFIGNTKIATKENPHANSEYYLEKYKSYEKFMKRDNKNIRSQKIIQREESAMKKSKVLNVSAPSHDLKCGKDKGQRRIKVSC